MEGGRHFGSDTPFDWSDGAERIQLTLDAFNSLGLPAAEGAAILEGNTRRLLHLDGAGHLS